MNENLKYLEVDLPEDLAKLKAYGDFDRLKRVIDLRLKKDIPKALKQRLELEKYIIDIIPKSYPYNYEEALKILQESFEDFKEEELEELRDLDSIDWYYINGEVHFKDDMVANLVKTVPELAKRVIDKKDLMDKEGNFDMLNEVIAKMKSKGDLAYKIRIKASIKLKKEAERPGKKIRVHIPIPIEYSQVKNFKILSTSHEPKSISGPYSPLRTVYFEEDYKEDDEFYVDYEFINHVAYKDPKPEEVSNFQPNFYTEEFPPHIVFNSYLRELTEEVLGDEKNPLIKARKIYDFITSKVMYSFVRPYFSITNIPTYGASSLKGDCGIQALLFITMCRIAKIPARWQAGLYANAKSIGNHDWAQFYIEPFGWLFADCSFGGAAYREGAEERWNFYFGNLEPFRMSATSSFQYDFNPQLNYLRRDPYDNQDGEIEYEDQRLSEEDYVTNQIVVDIEEVEI